MNPVATAPDTRPPAPAGTEQAARAALSAGLPREAARLFQAAGRPYEAAICFEKDGALEDCLAALLQVGQETPRYRAACIHAIRVAVALGGPVARLTPFVGPFLASGPASEREAAALLQLASACARLGKASPARALCQRVLAAYPGHPGAIQALQELGGESVAPPSQARPGRRPGRLGALLVGRGKLEPARLEQLLRSQPAAARSDTLLGEALHAEGLVPSLELLRARSELTGIPYIGDVRLLATAMPEAVRLLSGEQAERFKVVPVAWRDKALYLAMRDPRDIALLDQVRFAAGVPQVKGLFASEGGIRRALRKFYFGEELAPVRAGEEQLPAHVAAPFSDRYTGTREHEFDTREMEVRALQEALPVEARTVLSSVPTPPAVGSVFAGRYRLEALLGEGGSATVFRAADLELGEPMALKLFRPSARSEELVARFKQELSLSRRLNHPNIVRLFDLGSHAGWRYLTLELLEGNDLAGLLAERGPLPLAEGLRYLEQACAGLRAAHARGVIHRDIKPPNLFITRDGVLKVMDFGIAKKAGAPGVTAEGMIAGTPEYMSPEQIGGFSSVTHRTDLYALGCTAYAIFTGQPPFAGTEVTKVLTAQLNQPPLSLRARNPEVPPELDEVVLRLLQKDPARRFASCQELLAALQQVRQGLKASDPAL